MTWEPFAEIVAHMATLDNPDTVIRRDAKGWSKGAGPGAGEIDGPAGLYHHGVGTVQPLTLKAVCHHGDTAVRHLASRAAAVGLASQESTRQVPGETVGPVGRLLEQRHGRWGCDPPGRSSPTGTGISLPVKITRQT